MKKRPLNNNEQKQLNIIKLFHQKNLTKQLFAGIFFKVILAEIILIVLVFFLKNYDFNEMSNFFRGIIFLIFLCIGFMIWDFRWNRK